MSSRTEEFKELMEASGWKQAEIARRLRTSKGLISQYLTGKTIPSETMIKLFRMILNEEKPQAVSHGVSYDSSAIREAAETLGSLMKKLADVSREAQKVIYQIQRAKDNYPVSSETMGEAAELIEGAEEIADARLGAATPKSKKGSPSRGVSRGSPLQPSGHGLIPVPFFFWDRSKH